MSDTSFPVYMHYGTAAQRAAFTPAPPATGQPIYLWYETDTGLTYLYHTAWVVLSGGGSFNTPNAQGRLTLTTAVPFLVSTVTAATTIYYTPAVGNIVPIYNGTSFVPTVFSELSQTTTDNTKSPAAVANNSNYDLFVWNDSGTIRCTRGPLWTSDTARGAGAGTTELVRTNGILLNNVSITNGPAASRGTYVGSVRSNGSAQIDFIFGGAGGNGGEGTIVGLWNMYNRVEAGLANFDNINTYTYSSTTVRLKDAGTSTELNKIKYICGLQGDSLFAVNSEVASNSSGDQICRAGIGIDSTTTFTGSVGINRAAAGAVFSLAGFYAGETLLGFHFVAPLESSSATGTTTFIGDNGTTTENAMFHMRMPF